MFQSPHTPGTSPGVPRYRTLPSPNRKLHSVKSSPQLTLNEIFEEGESDAEAHDATPPALTPVNPAVASPTALRRFAQHRRKMSKSRAASCSSSDASDDDQETRKRKQNKIKGLQRRDSHDDSSDSQDPGGDGCGGVGGGGSNTRGQGHCSRTKSCNSKQSSGSCNGTHGSQGGSSTGNKTADITRLRKYNRIRETRSLNRISELHTIEIKEEEESEVSSPEEKEIRKLKMKDNKKFIKNVSDKLVCLNLKYGVSMRYMLDVNENGVKITPGKINSLVTGIGGNSKCCSVC